MAVHLSWDNVFKTFANDLQVEGEEERESLNKPFIPSQSFHLFLPDSEAQEYGELKMLIELLLEENPANEEMISQMIKDQERSFNRFDKNRFSICYFLAIAYESLNKNKDSAKWYLTLANCYATDKKSIFLMRNCLDRAVKLDSTLASDVDYMNLEGKVKKKEEAIQILFNELLKQIEKNSKKTGCCYLFYHDSKATPTWLRDRLSSDLPLIGFTVEDIKSKLESRMLNASNFVLSIFTSGFKKETENFNSEVSTSMNILMSNYSFAMTNEIPFLLEGNRETSTPSYFTKGEEDCVSASTLGDYYLNSLKKFCYMKGLGNKNQNQYFHEVLETAFGEGVERLEKED